MGKYKTNKKLRNILKNERDRETHVLFRKRLHLRMAASTYLIVKVKESNSCEVSLMILHCRGDGLTRSYKTGHRKVLKRSGSAHMKRKSEQAR